MTIPFLNIKPGAIRLKVVPRFPAQVIGGTGIAVLKANGNYTINWDMSEFAPTPTILDPANSYLAYWNSITGIYNRITAQNLLAEANIFPGAAWTLRGNPTPGTAFATDFKIDALVNKVTPVSADKVVIEDSADGSLKNVNLSDIPKAQTPAAAWTLRGNFTAAPAVVQDVNIDSLTLKALPLAADEVLIADSAAGYGYKKALLSAITEVLTAQSAWTLWGNPTAGSATPVAFTIHGLTLKATPVAADEVLLADSAVAFGFKRASLASITPTVNTMAAWTFKGNFTSGVALPNDYTLDGLTAKAQLVAADEVMVADSAAAFGLKKVLLSNLAVQSGVWTIRGNASGVAANPTDFTIDGLAAKATPVGGDELMIADSAAAFGYKKILLSSIPGGVNTALAQSLRGNPTGAAAVDTDFTITSLTGKASPISTDQVMIEDSTTSPPSLKKTPFSAFGGGGGGGGGADATTLIGFIGGLTLSTAGASITFSVAKGACTDSTNVDFLKLPNSFNKTTATWVVGSGNGALDTGSIAANTWYHVFLIKRIDTGNVDVLISTSPSAPLLTAPYTLFRRIGAIKTDGSSQWKAFTQIGNIFTWADPVVELANVTISVTTASVLTLSGAPPGVNVEAILTGYYVSGSNAAIVYFSSPLSTDAVPDSQHFSEQGIGTTASVSYEIRVVTNASGQYRVRVSAAVGSLQVNTKAYVDYRGSDAVAGAGSSGADPTVLQGWISGLTLSTAGASTTFSVAGGICTDRTNIDFIRLASLISKTTAAWAPGSGNGALDTGAIAANTWYHVHLIKRPDTGLVDALVSLSASAPTMPTNYSLARRIGSMRTDGSSNWTAFVQTGRQFEWVVPFTDMNGTPNLWTSTAADQVLTVPPGVSVEAYGYADFLASSSVQYGALYSKTASDFVVNFQQAAYVGQSSVFGGSGSFRLRTNTAAMIRKRSSDPTGTGNILTFGWYDDRGTTLEAGAQNDRPSIYAAPFDAMAYNGMQINGGCDVGQEIGTSNITQGGSATKYIADGWLAVINHAAGTCNFTEGQIANASFPAALAGFNFGVSIKANNANFNPANSDFVLFRTVFEGNRVARLWWGNALAQPFTYALQFYSTVSGVIFTRTYNFAGNRVYHIEHTVAAGWNFLIGTVPGDVTGTWVKDNTASMYFEVVVGGKQASPVAPNAWGTAPGLQTTNSTNLVGATNNQCVVTGFIMIPGFDVPNAARLPFIMRPFDQELTICQRYYEKSYEHGTTPGTNESNGAEMWFVRDLQATVGAMASMAPFKVPKRVAPSVTLYSISGTAGKASDIWNATLVNVSSGFVGQKRFWWSASPSAAFSVQQLAVQWTADARL